MDTWLNHLRPGLDGRVCIYNYYHYYYYYNYINKFEGVIRNRKWTEDRQHNDHWLVRVGYYCFNALFFIVAVAFFDVQNVAKSIGACKKKSLYNQPKSCFYKKILWSHFLIDFNKFYTKTLGIVHILCLFNLLIMFIWVVFICTSFFHDCYFLGFIFSWKDILENQSKFVFAVFKLCTNKNHS